ncbi:uncharacterized protein BKCO1_4000182 [Diplodia corticola]|uniref:Uncharacterized protein n=1 Tax=Diplodia corticola TaxID=236234 RepID=A0A1J9SGM7_9PEZI|nr:uncharacterized protein BKCO1_4000182 [Diplodia corticola]OJD38733.1 hypothetical protein BKCO1_4000182 [Diplodia corticola]
MVSLTTWGAMPQVPPSPTLTNPDLILPDLSDGQDSTPSPRLRFQAPPSPPSHLLRQSFQLAKAPPARRSRSNSRPATAMRMSSTGSVHFDGFDSEVDGDTTPKGQTNQEDHAPPQDTPRTNVMHNWQRDMERKAQEHARLGDADSANYSTSPDGAHGDSDGSGSADDSDGRYSSLPYVADSDGDTDNEQWLEGQEELDLEAISSAALSKRAEMILANAKKRLNLMEGNLRGARQSLNPPQRPPSYTSYHYYKRASSISPTPKGSGPIYIPQARHSSFHSTSNGSLGHSRVYSDISVSSVASPPNSVISHRGQPPEKRAVSAMGRFSGQWSPHDFSLGNTVGNRASGLRGVRSQEVIKHPWVPPEQHNHRSVSRTSNYQASPTLETLREDEGYNKTGADLRRSASTTSDLRAQMHDLKGRISSLKERAREEDMKRRSLQNLRTPSPFTAAPSWDSSADQYANGTPSSSSSEGNAYAMPYDSSPAEARNGYHEKESGAQQDQYDVDEDESSESGSEDTRILDDRGPTATEDVGYEDNNREVDGESIYEDAPQVIAERHEDRADAFDYEHFFLHSAMGTYTRENRSQSISSEDSVETTRPVSPPPKVPALPESALSPHRRTRSQDSISTVATFQTATEGNGPGSDSESEESNEALDQFTEQALGHQLPLKPSSQSLRSTSSGNSQLRSTGSFYSQHTSSSGQRRLRSAGSSIHSPGDSTPEILDPTSKIMASFFSQQKERGQLTPLKQKDEDLLYALTTSIQQVCARLQNAQDDDYETKVWRRRLDAARKILDGVSHEDI